MIVRDEAEVVADALSSVATLADEIVVVDTGSTDGTPDIARDCGARVFHEPWTGSFANARNVALAHATGQWVLVLDADERLDAAGCAALRRAVDSPRPCAWILPQWTYLTDPAVVGWTPNPRRDPAYDDFAGMIVAHQVRLVPRVAALRWEGDVHESPEASLQAAGIAIARLDEAPVHHLGRARAGRRQARKARLYLDLGRRKAARDGATRRATFELATQQMELGAFEDARQTLSGYLGRWGDDVDAVVLMARAEARTGRRRAAVERLERLARRHPRHAEGWNTLGTIVFDDDPRRALACFRRAVALDRRNANALGNVAGALGRLGRVDAARRALARARRLAPHAARYVLLDIRLDFDAGDVERGRRRLVSLPGADLAWSAVEVLQLVEMAILSGMMPRLLDFVRAHFDDVLVRVPVALEVAADLEINGFEDAAAELYARVVDVHPDTAPAHHALACILGNRGDLDRAIRHFALAVQLAPDSPDYLRNLALACERAGLAAQAARAYTSLVELDPGRAPWVRDRLEAMARRA